MPEPNERPVVDAVAAAILNGTPIDWPALEVTASAADREMLEELRLLCTVADLHRDIPSAADEVGAAGVHPTQYWGRLRLIERIGGGSFGDVYRAWDPRLRREVALKLIELAGHAETDSAAIIREGRLLARVRHPGVVTIYDAERIGHRVGLSMEFVEGQTLEARIKERGTLGAIEAINIGTQLASAMAAAHAAGVLHRDIKAANVIIRDDGRVVLMDFGAGRHLDDADGGATGTPMYLGPEVLAGGEATVRSDIYSLGVLLHYALTGRYPVEAASLAALREAHERRRDASGIVLRGISGRLAAVVARAVDPRPEARFESASAFESALAEVSAAAGVRGRVPVWLSAVAAVVVLLAGGWAAGLGQRPPDPVRIAVMPFELTGATSEDEELRGAATRDLITRLDGYDNVELISVETVESPSVKSLPIREAGHRLGVGVLLSGRLQRNGSAVTAVAALMRMPEGSVEWTREYSGSAEAIGSMNLAIVSDVTAHLRLRPAPGPSGRSSANLAAHVLYIKGLTALDRMGSESRRTAFEYFKAALKEDPDFPEVHAALADLYLDASGPYGPHWPREEALRLGSAAAERAMSLGPHLAATHLAAASLQSIHGDWQGAEASYQRALQVADRDVHVRQKYAHWLSLRGEFDRALEQANAAVAIEPMSARAILGVASVHRFARRWTDAIDYSNQAIAKDSNFGMAYHNLGHAYQGLGQLDRALEIFGRRPEHPNFGNALAQRGQVARAHALIAELAKQLPENPKNAMGISMVYCGLGEVELALDWLERYEKNTLLWPSTLKVAMVWDPLRDHPRFKAMLTRNYLD